MPTAPAISIKPGWRLDRWPLVIGAALMALALVMWRSSAIFVSLPLSASSVDSQAQRFVTLGLELERLYPSQVDSYFGPDSLRPPAVGPVPSLDGLKAEIAGIARGFSGSLSDPRQAKLKERTQRLAALLDQLAVKTPPRFDEEAQKLYGLEPTVIDQQAFARTREALERLLPGAGSLTTRVQAFRERYVVPERLRPALFARALAECRARTMRHWPLPAGEQLDVEWTSTVDAAWHRYRGRFHSTLQINPQAVAFVGSIVDVACHEGYPGHHAQFLLAEEAFRTATGLHDLPVEDTIVLLRSPGSVLREGAADFAVGLAFPAAERLGFERDVLFPMAGFGAEDAARFEQIRSLIEQLAPAALPILRAYRDHTITAEAAAFALEQDALVASPQALLGFVDTVGAYVSGYTVVREDVRGIVDHAGLTEEARWGRLRCLVLLADEIPLARIGVTINRSGSTAHSCNLEVNGGRP